MNHLINSKDFSLDEIEKLFERATLFLDEKTRNILENKMVITIFFENSTRTRSSFEIAAKRLGADVVSLDVSKSSSSKGETLFDTAANLMLWDQMRLSYAIKAQAFRTSWQIM